MASTVKICDLTQFYSPLSGGVKRYLHEKINYIQAQSSVRTHSDHPWCEDRKRSPGIVREFTRFVHRWFPVRVTLSRPFESAGDRRNCSNANGPISSSPAIRIRWGGKQFLGWTIARNPGRRLLSLPFSRSLFAGSRQIAARSRDRSSVRKLYNRMFASLTLASPQRSSLRTFERHPGRLGRAQSCGV